MPGKVCVGEGSEGSEGELLIDSMEKEEVGGSVDEDEGGEKGKKSSNASLRGDGDNSIEDIVVWRDIPGAGSNMEEEDSVSVSLPVPAIQPLVKI